jgi:hypothetical protein
MVYCTGRSRQTGTDNQRGQGKRNFFFSLAIID